MSDIYVVIRNQDGVAMTSVDGEPLRVFVRRDGLIYDQQPVSLRLADAFFYNFPLGRCSVVARHSQLSPVEAEQEVELPANVALRVRYIYLEPER
ncbi:MAG: hypothetical protein SXA11_11940 [Cyanobacteriota bacterium]|nr:hypothetical protein [Cyanobacteriota bacterium]